jgi:GTP-binding protein Era
MPKRCGFVTIIGAPNVGKSTLTNSLVGSKISIVSPKIQTTRRRVLGIVMREEAQIILVDTPGIFEPKKRLDRAMVSAAWTAAAQTDLLMVMTDTNSFHIEDTLKIIDHCSTQTEKPLFLVINKIDLVPRPQLLVLIDQLSSSGKIEKTFLISALKGDGVLDLIKALAFRMPEGPWLFPEDQLTDLPLRLLAAEITREKIFYSLHQEIPYEMTVETESWEEFQNGSVKISQVIHVQKKGQKAILLGKEGRQIKSIREKSALELQNMLGRQVHLFLYVKVSENWSEDSRYYKELGLDYDI